ncbi:hypothetical protein QWZ03_00740 [Chitinimonas viridis]|uniref:Uncharacterized protein n=1 Tax=Chitinimonas viridis TaxID=664880 RepID=A0ABT8AZ91_9NEIS|nr:hypothetical protein [Chitinimonas viridis]MDN3575297.1 hypothetical protein [Chitinimonas viridis]
MKSLLALLSLLFAANAAANPAQDALAELKKHDSYQWHYRVQESGDSNRLIRHDPDNVGKEWLLELIDGKPATAEQQASYQERRKKNSRTLRFRDLVDAASLTPLDAGPKPLRYRFNVKPNDSLTEVDPELLAGTLTLAPTGEIASILLYNPEPFRAKLVAKIEKFSIQVDFSRHASGALLPARAQTILQGNIGGVKELKQNLIQTYSDYRPSKQLASR